MTHDIDDRELEAWLKEAAPIADGDFTARVLQGLPPSRLHHRTRQGILLAAALLAILAGLWVLDGARMVWHAVATLLAPLAALSGGPNAVLVALQHLTPSVVLVGGTVLLLSLAGALAALRAAEDG